MAFIEKIKTILKRFDIDRAVSFSILARFWGFFAGPITAILIASCFTPELQGYHYTFASLLSFQVFAELGLGTVILQFASHEWSNLKMSPDGRIEGDEKALSRLRSIARFSSKWYGISSVLLVFALAIGGYIFFASNEASNAAPVNWLLPWLVLCFLTGINLFLLGPWSMLDGCNQMGKANYFRLIQSILNSVSVWLAILGGLNLWVAAVWNVVSILCALILFYRNYRDFFKSIYSFRIKETRLESVIDWRTEMLPLQWRIAVSWLANYFTYSLFTPILFRFHGPVIAGQMGMTWSLVAAVSAIAGAWPNSRIPQFGMLVAQQKQQDLDKLFRKQILISVSVAGIGVLSCLGLIGVLHLLESRFASRLLAPLPAALFLFTVVFQMIFHCIGVYLRAHKREPLMIISVIAALAVVFSNFVLGKPLSVLGMGAGFLAIHIVLVPFAVLIFKRERKEKKDKLLQLYRL